MSKMKSWTCIAQCTWGAAAHESKMYVMGDIVNHPTKPNKHFCETSKLSKEYDFDKMDVKDISVEQMHLMTKEELNDKFELGVEDNTLKSTLKEVLIKAAIDKSNLEHQKRNKL